jgi:hypothetical protein
MLHAVARVLRSLTGANEPAWATSSAPRPRSDPEHADHARMLLHDLEIERICREAISLLVQYEA